MTSTVSSLSGNGNKKPKRSCIHKLAAVKATPGKPVYSHVFFFSGDEDEKMRLVRSAANKLTAAELRRVQKESKGQKV